MKSKLVQVAIAGVSMLACTAVWIGCGASTTTGDTTTTDAGGTTGEGGTNTDGGTTGDGGGGTDSSTKPDAAITGPYVDLAFGSCPAFTPCGGDPTGMWKITGGCVDDTAFAGAKAQCAGLAASNVKFQARGTILADATTIARSTDVKFTATFAVPPECTMNQACAAVAIGIKLTGAVDTATCAPDAAVTGGCTCDVGKTITESTSDTYTTADNVLTTGAGSTARTYDYCVNGSEVKYKETTAQTAVPALFTLTK